VKIEFTFFQINFEPLSLSICNKKMQTNSCNQTNILERINKLRPIITFYINQKNMEKVMELNRNMSTLRKLYEICGREIGICGSDNVKPSFTQLSEISSVDNLIAFFESYAKDEKEVEKVVEKEVVQPTTPIPEPFSLDYYIKIAEIKGVVISNVKDIVKNAYLFSLQDLSKVADLDHDYFDKPETKLILGYYTKQFERSLHSTDTSAIMLGLILGVHGETLKLFINGRTDLKVVKLLDEYIEKGFIDTTLLIPFVSMKHDAILREIVLRKFSYKQLIDGKCQLLTDEMKIAHNLIDISM
jgi:hypothetical protein